MNTAQTSPVWPILRLAWKLSRRRWERQSPILGGIAVLVTVIGVGSAVAATVLAFILGVALLPGAEPFVLMLVWDGVIAAFLLMWLMGLLIQLQLGGEGLSLEKLLHMPVSPLTAFLMNFAGSQMRVSLLIFLGLMLGLGAASVATLGPAHLILIPLVLVFVTLVASVTYQFQSWLTRLFVNKRRRGTVVAAAVLLFVALANLPALLNRFLRDADVSIWEVVQVEKWMLIANGALPPGWLALGAWGAGRAQVWIGALAILGMAGMAAMSLRRSYRKTLGALAQDGPSRPSAPKPSVAAAKKATTISRETALVPIGLTRLIDRFAGYIPDQSRAVAWVAMRVWTRAPQGKMVLLSPVLLVLLYVLIFQDMARGDWAAHFATLAMMGFMIMMAFNLFSNLFGQDGNGFRAVVLAGVPPRELLLGKNLALLPYALVVGSMMIAVLQWIHPLPVSHVLANIVQLFVLYLVGCMLGNSFSIRMPWPMSPTSMGMRNATAASFLASFLILLLLLVVIVPLALPIWFDKRLAQGGSAIPVYLVFSLLEIAAVWFIYRRSLASKGRLLAERIETVLGRVTQPID